MISAVKYDELPQSDVLKIYPNPASGYSVIATFPLALKKKSVLNVTDVLGREYYKKEILANTLRTEIPISSLPAGIYYVLVSSEDGMMSQKLEVVR